MAIDLAIRWTTLAVTGAPLVIATLLTVISVIALMFSGWLGGQLVYHFHLGVEEPGQKERAVFRITLTRQAAERAQHTQE